MNVVILIPARLDSTRLPGKMLADVEGVPLLVRTWMQALKSRLASKVAVATDSVEIAEVLGTYGAEVVMTSAGLTCGTERIAEAARRTGGDVFVNLQGDEPLISPDNIDLVIEPFLSADPPDCSTLVFPMQSDDSLQIEDPHVVKALLDRKGHALYFSRSPVPFRRNRLPSTAFYRHIGLYAFSAAVLQEFASLPPSMLEESESLEQLRLLENGFRIKCVVTGTDNPGVNTMEELELVRSIVRGECQGQ
jgi:3-deoxy-manno-octulosonate cytidylyltransferase (CMP-KDO synthetase)